MSARAVDRLPEAERMYPVVIDQTRTYLVWIAATSQEDALKEAEFDSLGLVNDTLPFTGDLRIEAAEQIDIEADRSKIPFGPWRPGEPHSYDWQSSSDHGFINLARGAMEREAERWAGVQ